MALMRVCLSHGRCLARFPTSLHKVQLSAHRNISYLEAALIDPVFWFTGQGVAITVTRYAGERWSNIARIALGVTAVSIFSGVYAVIRYMSETNPFTDRKQLLNLAASDVDYFTGVNKEALKKVPNMSKSSFEWMRLKKVLDELLCANKDNELITNLEKLHFEIKDSPRMNSYILPSGHISITTGLIHSLKTKEELAFLVAHDIAHAALQHGNERGTEQMVLGFLSYPATILTTIGCSIIKNPAGKRACLLASSCGFLYMMYRVLLRKPYTELMELEADHLGQELCSKACYGVKGGINFLNSTKAERLEEATEYNLYHPQSSSRPQALKDRHESLVKLQMTNCQNIEEVKKFAKELIQS